MSKRETYLRYNFIIKRLQKTPSTFKEIENYLERESELQSYNFVVSKRTFQRDLDDIRSIFDLDIQFDFSRKVYFINQEEKSHLNERMLEAFDTFNALNVTDRISKYIHFENRKPQGTENLYGLIHAIKNNVLVKFTYFKFWEEESEERTIEPLALKEFKNRWYVIGNDMRDNIIKTFALDRLNQLEITNTPFKYPKDFDIENHFQYCFGIISPNDEEPKNIVLSFTPFQGKYIKTLVLHKSQKVLIDNSIEYCILLKLCITHDFIMELLSYGDNVKVLKPKSLIDEIKLVHQKAIKQYENK